MKANHISDLQNRRNRMDLMLPAELAIFNAMQEIEKIGADMRLTEAQILLTKAKDFVSDFIEETGFSVDANDSK